MTPLRQRMSEDMQVRNLAPHTQRSYLQQVSQFARHFGQSPELLGPDDIRAYQLHLIQDRRLSASSILVAVAAVRFLGVAQIRVTPKTRNPFTIKALSISGGDCRRIGGRNHFRAVNGVVPDVCRDCLVSVAASTSFAFNRIKPESEMSPRLSGRLLCVSSMHGFHSRSLETLRPRILRQSRLDCQRTIKSFSRLRV